MTVSLTQQLQNYFYLIVADYFCMLLQGTCVICRRSNIYNLAHNLLYVLAADLLDLFETPW